MDPRLRYKSQAVCEKGIRPNNQDAIAPDPNETDQQTNVYVVCDGVGGGSKGEVASRICANTMLDCLAGFDQNDFDTELYTEGLRDSEALIERYIAKNPGNESMSTTLTWIRFTDNGEAHIGWVGDSRIYQFRDGKIVYQTNDHSLVNAMVKAGDITAEEARTHPQKNVILRAVSGVGEPAVMEMQRLTDIKSGDRFLLCTDGVTDALSNQDLSDFLESGISVNDAVQKINETCALNSKDNYSCYLVELEFEEKKQSINEKAQGVVAKEKIEPTTEPVRKSQTTSAAKAKAKASPKKTSYGLPIVLGVLLAGLVGMYFAYNYFEGQKETAIYESHLSDAEVFYHQGAYGDAIERFEQAERMRPLNPVMKGMLDSSRIKNLLPVYSNLQVSALNMLKSSPAQAIKDGRDAKLIDGFAFTCLQPIRISGLHYFIADSSKCIKTKRQIHFNVDVPLPLQVDSTSVVFWTTLPDELQPHFIDLIVLDEKGMEAHAVQFGDEEHYENACDKIRDVN